MPVYLKDEEAERRNDSLVNRYDSKKLQAIIRSAELLLRNIGLKTNPEHIKFHVLNEDEMHDLYPSMKCAGLTQPISYKDKTHNIWLLEDQPYIRLLSVVAHEMGHTWCRDHRINFSKMEEEGFCELLAYHVLSTQFSKHGNTYMSYMIRSSDPIYGEGLRHMKKQFEICGSWFKFLGYIKINRI